jgi:hypothetical protein
MNVEDPPGSIVVCRQPAGLSLKGQERAEQSSAPDPAYHESREQAEHKAAKDAKSVRARRIHQELAQAHSQKGRCGGWPRGH